MYLFTFAMIQTIFAFLEQLYEKKNVKLLEDGRGQETLFFQYSIYIQNKFKIIQLSLHRKKSRHICIYYMFYFLNTYSIYIQNNFKIQLSL